MSLAIIYKGRKRHFKLRVSQRRLLSFLGVAAFLSLAAIKPWQPSDFKQSEIKASITQKRISLTHEAEAVTALRDKVQRELSAMTIKMGELHGQLMRLEAFGQRLTSSTHLDIEAIDFLEPLPVGGPETALDSWPLVKDHNLLNELDQMLDTLKERQNQLRLLESVLVNHQVEEARFIAGRPVSTGWLSSQYGIRKDPFSGNPTMHRGIDYAAPLGTPVAVTGAGIVTFAGRRAGFGNMVEVDHGAGLRTRYAHLDSYQVSAGDVLTRGETLGKVGQTGRSTGPHVHYEVLQNGRHLNPVEYVTRAAPKE